MTATDLRTPFVLEAPEDADDGAGGVRRTWSALGTIWGQLKPGGVRETISGEAGVGRTTHRVLFRGVSPAAPSRPTARHRLRLGARVFRVIAVHEADPAGKYLEARVIEETVS